MEQDRPSRPCEACVAMSGERRGETE